MQTINDQGPFYHGTTAPLKEGDLLVAGHLSNYYESLIMNHVYFTATLSGACLAAELALGDLEPRVYIVEPTGEFENDPNLTDQKFPGNPTRSYRSQSPLKIIGEVKGWERLSEADLQKWKDTIAQLRANPQAKIIN